MHDNIFMKHLKNIYDCLKQYYNISTILKKFLQINSQCCKTTDQAHNYTFRSDGG
jgi:hypothetical protein